MARPMVQDVGIWCVRRLALPSAWTHRQRGMFGPRTKRASERELPRVAVSHRESRASAGSFGSLLQKWLDPDQRIPEYLGASIHKGSKNTCEDHDFNNN